MIRPPTAGPPARWPIALLAALAAAIPLAASAEDVLLASPVFDQNDRIELILGALTPAPSIQRLAIEKRAKPTLWSLNPFERESANLDDAKWVVLEAVHAAALENIPVDGGGSLARALPGWVRRGGHLLVVGGFPSFESYPGTPLAGLLPVEPALDEKSGTFKATKRRRLRGGGADGRYADHLHPTTTARGEVLIDADGRPFAVRHRVGDGVVVAVLGGIVEYFTPDALLRDEDEFFNSTSWERFLVDAAGAALKRPVELGPLPDLGRLAIPAARTGSRIRSDFWFPGTSGGRLALAGPDGEVAWSAEPDGSGRYQLPDDLRHGVYRARLSARGDPQERDVRIGGPADQTAFDIRLFSHAHGPYPWGLAPGEAHARAVELRNAGVTSVVYGNHSSKRIQSQRDVRALREIVGAGLDIVYMHSIRHPHWGREWPFPGRAPARAIDSKGKDAGWDQHDEAFRRGIDALLDEVDEVRALPNIRALQVIEENRDGGRRSPSLRDAMRSAGLTGDEGPGDPGWHRYQEIRSRATGVTYQRFRAMAQRFLPGVPLATYWPGSYWGKPAFYELRVGELARAVDELLGPGYGYMYAPFDIGWISVVGITAQMFAAQDHARPPGGGRAVYALTDIHEGAPGEVGPRSWRDTAWTSLGHGATSLAYFHLPRGAGLRPLVPLHDELFRVGPWIAGARRRPAPVAILASWTTRALGDEEQITRHRKCMTNIHMGLVKASVEEVDYLLEEQVDRPPDALRAIVVAGAPFLADETIDGLTRFAEAGGTLIVEPESARRGPDGPRLGDPWQRARVTGRMLDMPFGGHCSGATASLVAQLDRLGIESVSSTPKPRTEARLLGGGGLWIWVLLNHGETATEIDARARLSRDGITWRDLRSGGAAGLLPGSETRLRRQVGAGDAAVLIGVERPAASLSVATEVAPDAIRVNVSVLDSAGRPVADGYPVELDARDADGAQRLPAKARSRTTRDGSVRFRVPIPLGATAGSWRITASEPVAGRSASASPTLADATTQAGEAGG